MLSCLHVASLERSSILCGRGSPVPHWQSLGKYSPTSRIHSSLI